MRDDLQIGGRLRHFTTQWLQITQNPWVLRTVRGHRLEFSTTPLDRPPAHTRPLPVDQEEALDREIEELLRKKAVEPVTSQGGFYSPMFAVPKTDGGWRPIINLKRLNSYIEVSHFKMESILALRDLLRPGDFMGKVDLKDAYLTVPISREDRRFLRFAWKGRRLQFTSLPFGLATAPRTFTKLLKPVAMHLRKQGLRIIVYLDDILLMADSAERLNNHMEIMTDTLQQLGFILNRKKCILHPQQRIEFLGFCVDSTTMTLSLPQHKVLKIEKECRHLRNQGEVSARQLAHIIGLLNATNPAVLPARMHYRSLQRLKNRTLGSSRDFDQRTRLDVESLDDISFWTQTLRQVNGRPIQFPSASLVISSDASREGWGAACGERSTGGPWTRAERREHINFLELKAVFLALQTFITQQRGQHVMLLVDNTTAIAYLNHQGGTCSRKLSDLAIKIWGWALDSGLTLHAEHIPGVLNVAADRESRRTSDPSDWMLSQDVFQELMYLWGPCNIDLFAARHNSQLPAYYSFRPDPQALAMDALAQEWHDHKPYLFPPFILIGRSLQKILADRVEEAVLIAPIWPAQTWFATALQMLVEPPRAIPSSPAPILNPAGEPHPLAERLQLAAWRVSGNLRSSAGFRRRLSSSSAPRGGKGRKNPIALDGDGGVVGAVDGIPIPCLPL